MESDNHKESSDIFESPESANNDSASIASSKKKLIHKWWFWAIIVIAVAGIIIAFNSNNSSHSTYASSYSYESPYVTAVKDSTNSQYGIKYGKAFNSFFTSPSWEYFQASTGEDVVEFTGGFSYNGSPATAKIQFVLDLDDGSFTAEYLSINGVSQNRLTLAAMIDKVFSSY